MTVSYLDLTDSLAIVAEVTGLDVETAIRITDLDLADSALHAPNAGWGDADLYADFVDKAAVLVPRLCNNRPLPDGLPSSWLVRLAHVGSGPAEEEGLMFELAAAVSKTASSSGLYALTIIYVVLIVFELAAGWRVFTKAGRPGWAIIVPIYNIYVLLKMVGRSGWWILALLIPIVNVFVALVIAIDLARAFGKGTGFGFGLWLLAPIFYPILAFGSARYRGGPRYPVG